MIKSTQECHVRMVWGKYSPSQKLISTPNISVKLLWHTSQNCFAQLRGPLELGWGAATGESGQSAKMVSSALPPVGSSAGSNH